MHYYYDQYDGFGWGHAVFGGVMMLLVWALIIGGIVYVVRSISRNNDRHAPLAPPRANTAARDALDMRLAKGEISDDDYKRLRSLLDGSE